MTERDIYLEAIEIHDPTERNAYLDQVCADLPGLRVRVEELLKAREEAGSFLNAPHSAVPQQHATSAYSPPAEETAGKVVAGKYTLVEPIGVGGMGAVWRAKQSEPVK